MMGNGKATARLRDKYRLRRAMLARVPAEPETTGPELPEIDPAQVAELESKAASLAEENAQLRDVTLRQKAEFDNFRRRTLKEKDQIRDAAKEDVLVKLLPVVDNFDRALDAAQGVTDPAPLREGIEMVAGQLKRILEAENLSRIESMGLPFNPEEHEAIAVDERTDIPENHVAGVMLPGYRYREKVVRPAMVRVAKAPNPPAQSEAAPEPVAE